MKAVELSHSTHTPRVSVPDPVAAIWLRLFERPWASLALVSTSQGASAESLSSSFEAMAARCGVEASSCRQLDLRGTQTDALPAVQAELAQARAKNQRVVVLVDSPSHSPLASAVVRAADACLLLVRLGEASAAAVEADAAECPADRTLGSVIVS